ncbi:MAG: RNA polymerase sigma factor [Actinomycetes bacterium]
MASLEQLLHDNYSMMRAVCWRILSNESDADDATQNAMIAIAKNFSSFDERSAFSTWAYRIATNAALDELRRRRRRPLTLLGQDNGEAPDIADPRSEDQFSHVDAHDELSSALALIPEEYRVALVLRDVADLDYEEIGRVLDVPIGTVRSRIARGRARLTEILGNQNPGDERQTPDSESPS